MVEKIYKRLFSRKILCKNETKQKANKKKIIINHIINWKQKIAPCEFNFKHTRGLLSQYMYFERKKNLYNRGQQTRETCVPE